ncbi:MAG: toprim domain-containing protein [Muribaculum sp.]|nr:toprim domain-containing protein [Muribaculum sp.]
MIEEIKKIPLATFLSKLGYEPSYRRGNGLWYRSPLRQENTPSFKVQLDKNTWYDFGIAKGGTIIDLAAGLYHSDDIRYLMDCIIRCCPVPSSQTVAFSFAPRHSAPSFENIEIVPLGIPALFAYLKERGIPAHIAKANCTEAHYVHNGKPYFAIAFPNISGGAELRNRYFKGCIAPKDISIPNTSDYCNIRSPECSVFEGFMDYMSALTMSAITDGDAIVLNSVANVNRAILYLSRYDVINCYLDNDDAGRHVLSVLSATFGERVVDHSTRYSQYNDFNDYIVQHPRNTGLRL